MAPRALLRGDAAVCRAARKRERCVQTPPPQTLRRPHRGPVVGALFTPPYPSLLRLFPSPSFFPGAALPAGFTVCLPAVLPAPAALAAPDADLPMPAVMAPSDAALLVGVGAAFKRLFPQALHRSHRWPVARRYSRARAPSAPHSSAARLLM